MVYKAWIGWIEEVAGGNCQEATRQQLVESLRGTLAEAIEFNGAEARCRWLGLRRVAYSRMKRRDLGVPEPKRF